MSAHRGLRRPQPLDLWTARLLPIDRPARDENGRCVRYEPLAFLGAHLRPDLVVLLNGHNGEQLGQAVRIDVEDGWLVGDFETVDYVTYAVRSGLAPGLSPSYDPDPERVTRRGHVDYIERADLLHVALSTDPAYPDAGFVSGVYTDHGQLRTWPEVAGDAAWRTRTAPAADRLRSAPPYPLTTWGRWGGWSAASWRRVGAPLA